MKRTRTLLISLAFSSVLLLNSSSSVMAAPSADELYAKAYNAVISCQNSYTQQSINSARSAINNMKGSGAAWAIGEFSKQVDSVQQKLFEEFMGLLFNSNNKPKPSIPQTDINKARDLVNSFATYQGNAPYVKAWSSAVDGYQQIIIKEVVTLFEQAKKTNTTEDIIAARNGVKVLLTANNNQTVIDFANTLNNELDRLVAPIVIEELPLSTKILEPDSMGNRYMQATYINNSNYNIIGFSATILLKSTNETVYLSSYDTVLKGEKSPNFKTFTPVTGDKNNMEYLMYEVTAVDKDGNVLYLYYDVKLNQYAKMYDKIDNSISPIVKIGELSAQISSIKQDSMGNSYIDATYKNNSSYKIEGLNVTALLKNNNEKVYITSYDTVLKGGTSPKFEAYIPQNITSDQIEVLKYDIVVVKDDGSKVYLEYDVKLNLYTSR